MKPLVNVTQEKIMLEVLKLDKEKKYNCEIKLYRKKRSKTANDKAWVLIGKLAKKIRITPLEVYKTYIKDLGIYREIEIDNNSAKTFITAWKSKGLGWICEKIDESRTKGFSLLHAYYGSSSYNTSQMYRFITLIINDCKIQGIETMSPEELKRLIGEWGNVRTN